MLGWKKNEKNPNDDLVDLVKEVSKGQKHETSLIPSPETDPPGPATALAGAEARGRNHTGQDRASKPGP